MERLDASLSFFFRLLLLFSNIFNIFAKITLMKNKIIVLLISLLAVTSCVTSGYDNVVLYGTPYYDSYGSIIYYRWNNNYYYPYYHNHRYYFKRHSRPIYRHNKPKHYRPIPKKHHPPRPPKKHGNFRGHR